MATRRYTLSLGAACECDLASLVRHDPQRFPALRAFCFVAVREWLPRPLRDAAAISLYELAHPRGSVGRLLGRQMPEGPTLDPWGKSYLPVGQRGYDTPPSFVTTPCHDLFCFACVQKGQMVKISDPYKPCPACGHDFGFPHGCPWPKEVRDGDSSGN